MAKFYQPYSEIIDLQSELNEYKKLCDGKSTKYKYYLDWKSNIKNKLSCLDSDEKKKNFIQNNIHTFYYINICPFSILCFCRKN